MNKSNSLFILLISINVGLSFAAFDGLFEGKDMLPIIIGIVSVILSSIFLFAKRKKNIKLKLLGLFLVVITAIGLYYSHFNVFLNERENISRENSIQVLSGKKAPTVSYERSINLDDGVTVSEIYTSNKFTILNFWATWCAPCLKEMPILEAFYKENKAKGIAVIGFTDYKDKDINELTKIEQLVEKLDISYPIVIDAGTDVRVKYKADILPATVLIDEKGEVIDYQIGVNGAKQIMNYTINNL